MFPYNIFCFLSPSTPPRSFPSFYLPNFMFFLFSLKQKQNRKHTHKHTHTKPTEPKGSKRKHRVCANSFEFTLC